MGDSVVSVVESAVTHVCSVVRSLLCVDGVADNRFNQWDWLSYSSVINEPLININEKSNELKHWPSICVSHVLSPTVLDGA